MQKETTTVGSKSRKLQSPGTEVGSKSRKLGSDACLAEMEKIVGELKDIKKRLTVIYKGRPELTDITTSAVKANLDLAELVQTIADKNPESWPPTLDKQEMDLSIAILKGLNDMDALEADMTPMRKAMRKCAGSISVQTANKFYAYHKVMQAHDKKSKNIVEKIGKVRYKAQRNSKKTEPKK